MPEIALPLSGVTVVYANGSRHKADEGSFTFRIGIARFAGTVYCMAHMEATDERSLVQVGVLSFVQKEAGQKLAELPNDEMLEAVRTGYLEHVIFDAAAATLRQLAAMVISKIQIPSTTEMPEYYLMDLDATDMEAAHTGSGESPKH